MHRLLIACLLGLACLLADGRSAQAQPVQAQAEPLRYPATGEHHFIVNLLPGWMTQEDKVNGGLQVLPKERWGAIYLALATEPRMVGKPLVELARGISQSAKITLSGQEEDASISGRPGRAFYGVLVTGKGNELDARIVIVPLAADVFATASTLAAKGLTQARQQSLEEAFKAIAVSK